MRARGGAGAGAAAGDIGGGGFSGGGTGGSSPVSYNPGAPDTGGDAYQQQLNDLDVQAKQEALKEQQSMFDLQRSSAEQQLAYQGKANDLYLQGAQQELDVSGAQAQLATSQINQVTKEVQSGKIKGECGKGESSAYDRNTGQFFCKASGKSGIKTAGDELGRVTLDIAKQYEQAYAAQYMPAGGVGSPTTKQRQNQNTSTAPFFTLPTISDTLRLGCRFTWVP